MKREILIDETSFFMSIPVIIAMTFCCIAALYWSLDEVAAVLLFLILIGLVAQIYSHLTLRSIEVSVECEQRVVFPGERMRLCCRIRNTGKLPILNFMIRIPISRYGPVAPADEADYRSLSDAEISKARMYSEQMGFVLEKRVPYIRGGESLNWEPRLRAVKRGETVLEDRFLYCGDPFGLIHTSKNSRQNCRILVCAQIVPVRVEPFLHNLKFSSQGAKSIHEDVTLIKGNRPYQLFDPVKSINWKLLASQDKWVVNLYDPVCTKQVHLIFDGESYNRKEIPKAALENTLRILFSVIFRLYEKGMGCGISLPKSRACAPRNLMFRDHQALSVIAEYLAKYQILDLEDKTEEKHTILQERSSLSSAIIRAREEKEKARAIPKSRSLFRVKDLLEKNGNIGEYFYFTYDGARFLDNKMLVALAHEKVTIVSYKRYGGDDPARRGRAIHISEIGEGIKR